MPLRFNSFYYMGENIMDVMDAIRTRRSIRKYRSDSVEEEKVTRVLEAGHLAPSANNRQEWRFVVVRDAVTRRKLSEAACQQRFVAEAPVVIVCCSVEEHHIMTCGHPAYAIDLAIAIDHMTLAAAELGLGTCWIGAFHEDKVRNILRIPGSVRVVELLTLGYPGEKPSSRPRKRMDEIVFWDVWK
jgi:nitroreductase